MTVEADNVVRLTYTGAGITGPFTTPQFLADADIRAIKVLIADGTETELALTTDFSLTGAGEEAGGALTLVDSLSSSYKIVIINDAVDSQLAEYPRNDPFPSATHQAVVDRRTMVSQRITDRLDRAVRMPDGDTTGLDPELPAATAAARGDKVIGFNSAGTALELKGAVDNTLLAAQLASTAVGNGAALVGFAQSGTRPASGTVAAELFDLHVNVKSAPYLAAGDGTTDDSAAIQAAITACGAAGGGIVFFPEGVYVATGLTVSSDQVALVGTTTRGSRIRFTNTTGTLFTITGALFRLEGFEFETPAATHSAGAIFDIQGSQGNITDIRINGAFWDVFKMESSAGDDWIFDKVRVVGGSTLNSCWRLKSASGTIADTHIINPIIATTATWTEAAITLDTLVDTFRITGGTLGGIGKIIHIKDSGAGQDPRFIHISDVYIEDSSSTADLVTIDAGDDIRFTNCYFGLALNHAVINNGRDIAFKNSHFISPQRSSVDYNDGLRVAIEGNTFLDASQATDVTYSTIDIAASVTAFRVVGNTFRLRSGTTNKPLRQLTIGSGSGDKFFIGENDWGVAGTDYGAAGAAAVSDASSGTNVVVTDNTGTVLYRGGAAISHTGTLVATAKISLTLPAGALRTNDGIEFEVAGTTAGTNGTKDIAFTFGGTTISTIQVPGANTDTWTLRGRVFGANSVTAQTFFGHATRTAADTEGTVIRNKAASGSVDTTAAVTITVTCTLANTGDTIVIRSADIRVVRR